MPVLQQTKVSLSGKVTALLICLAWTESCLCLSLQTGMEIEQFSELLVQMPLLQEGGSSKLITQSHHA